MIEVRVESHWSNGSKFYTAIYEEERVGKMFLKRASRIKDFDHEAYGVQTFPVNKIFYIDYIRVDLEFRNQRIATQILTACKQWAHISRNILTLDALPLDDTITQAVLINFYKGHGFKIPPSGTSNKTYCSMNYHTRLKQN